MKTSLERAGEKRAEELEVVRRHSKRGSPLIRELTDEECRRYPPRLVVRQQQVRW